MLRCQKWVVCKMSGAKMSENPLSAPARQPLQLEVQVVQLALAPNKLNEVVGDVVRRVVSRAVLQIDEVDVILLDDDIGQQYVVVTEDHGVPGAGQLLLEPVHLLQQLLLGEELCGQPGPAAGVGDVDELADPVSVWVH